MIDIHCHLLPGIDDGPPDIDTALALARACVDDGIRCVVATPHVFPGRYDNDSLTVQAAHTAFARRLADEGIPLQLLWAGEARCTPELLDLALAQRLPLLGQSDGMHNLLLEMPDGQIPLGAITLVRRLGAMRVRPVFVHPERNRAVMDDPGRLQAFIDEGCLVQVTAGSVIGQFGSRAQATAHQLLQAGWVTAIASDAHNLKGRLPRMREARAWLQQHLGEAVALQLTETGPAALCQGNLAANGLLGGAADAA